MLIFSRLVRQGMVCRTSLSSYEADRKGSNSCRFFLVPEQMAVKMLFVRGKFGWGPEETGQWITFLAMTRVVLLVLIVPFIVKYLRKPVPIPLEPRPEVDEDNVDSAQAALRWDAEAARLKKAADTGSSRLASDL